MKGDGGGGSGRFSKLPTVGDDDVGLGFAVLAAVRLHGLHQLHPLHHLPKHHVLPVQPASTHSSDRHRGGVVTGALRNVLRGVLG